MNPTTISPSEEEKLTAEEQAEIAALDQFESSPELYAWLYRREGEDFLRQLLDMAVTRNSSNEFREPFERDAVELEEVGLPHVARLLWETAERLPSKYDHWQPEPYHLPYPHVVRQQREANERQRQKHQDWLKTQKAKFGITCPTS